MGVIRLPESIRSYAEDKIPLSLQPAGFIPEQEVMMDELLKLFGLLAKRSLYYVDHVGKGTYFSIPVDQELQNQLYTLAREAGLTTVFQFQDLIDVLYRLRFKFEGMDSTGTFQVFKHEGILSGGDQ